MVRDFLTVEKWSGMSFCTLDDAKRALKKVFENECLLLDAIGQFYYLNNRD